MTLASQIISKLWCEADVTPVNHAASVTYSQGHGVDRHEIDALVVAEEPCRDAINEDASTLQKYAEVQRVHQTNMFDNKSFTVDHDRKRKSGPVSQRSKHPQQRSKSVLPTKELRGHGKFKRDQLQPLPSHSRSSVNDKENQQRFTGRTSKRDSSLVRHSVPRYSSTYDWQDCPAQPGVASAVMINRDKDHSESINVRLTLRQHERVLERLREEIRCLDYTLAEREVVASSEEDDAYFGAVMFGAGWQIPRDKSSARSRTYSSAGVSYVPTAPGFSSNEGIMSSGMSTASNRRSTMSSVVMPRRYEFATAMGYDDVQYVQDYDLQMSMPVNWYAEGVIGFDDDPSVHWSLDPSIMDAPMEVLINETNCWQHQRQSSQMRGVPMETHTPFATEDSLDQDVMSSQYADLRRRERVRKEVEKDSDDQKKNRSERRRKERRPWFKP